MRVISYGTLYNSVLMPLLAEDLAYFEAVVAEQQPASGTRMREITDRAQRLPVQTTGQEQYWGVICSDGKDPNTIDAWVEVTDDDTYEGFGDFWAWGDRACEDWSGIDRDRYNGPWDTDTASPVLYASTTYDPATPYENAIAAEQGLPDAGLLTVTGWNHTALGLSACGDATLTAYLLTRQVPAANVTCPQDLLPFGVPAAATPVDEVGVPITSDPAEEAPEEGEPVTSEAVAEEIAEQQGIPEELVDAAVVDTIVAQEITEEEAARHLKVSALAEARQLAVTPDTPREPVRP